MITIFHGTDRLSIDERVASIRAAVDPTGISTTVIDDAATDLGAVRTACGALGFFGGGRVVVSRDLLVTSQRRGRRSKAEPEKEAVLNLLSGVPDETTLLVVEKSVDSRTERGVRSAVSKVTVERLDVPRGRRLIEWTCERARHYQALIGQDEARQLLEALFPGNWPAESRRDDVPPDLYRLDAEIAKLAVATGSEQAISSSLISALVPGADAQNFWGITNAIMSGNASEAVIEIERAYGQGSAAEAILGQITSQFEVLAVTALSTSKSNLRELSSVTGLSEGRLRQSMRAASAFPAGRVSTALTALRDLDAAAKQGSIELEEALVPLVASLAAGMTFPS